MAQGELCRARIACCLPKDINQQPETGTATTIWPSLQIKCVHVNEFDVHVRGLGMLPSPR